MAVGMGILYNNGDLAILYFVLLAINVCLCFCMFHTLKVSDNHAKVSDLWLFHQYICPMHL